MKRTQNRPEVTEKRLMSNSQEGKYLAKKDLSDLAYLRSYLAIMLGNIILLPTKMMNHTAESNTLPHQKAPSAK